MRARASGGDSWWCTSGLTLLSLRGCGLRDSDGVALASALAGATAQGALSLETLDLSGNDIRDAGGCALILASACGRSPSGRSSSAGRRLRTLVLEACRIGPGACESALLALDEIGRSGSGGGLGPDEQLVIDVSGCPVGAGAGALRRSLAGSCGRVRLIADDDSDAASAERAVIGGASEHSDSGSARREQDRLGQDRFGWALSNEGDSDGAGDGSVRRCRASARDSELGGSGAHAEMHGEVVERSGAQAPCAGCAALVERVAALERSLHELRAAGSATVSAVRASAQLCADGARSIAERVDASAEESGRAASAASRAASELGVRLDVLAARVGAVEGAMSSGSGGGEGGVALDAVGAACPHVRGASAERHTPAPPPAPLHTQALNGRVVSAEAGIASLHRDVGDLRSDAHIAAQRVRLLSAAASARECQVMVSQVSELTRSLAAAQRSAELVGGLSERVNAACACAIFAGAVLLTRSHAVLVITRRGGGAGGGGTERSANGSAALADAARTAVDDAISDSMGRLRDELLATQSATVVAVEANRRIDIGRVGGRVTALERRVAALERGKR